MQGIFLQVSSIPEENHIGIYRSTYVLESTFIDCTLIHITLSTYPDMNKSRRISKEASGLCYGYVTYFSLRFALSDQLLFTYCLSYASVNPPIWSALGMATGVVELRYFRGSTRKDKTSLSS